MTSTSSLVPSVRRDFCLIILFSHGYDPLFYHSLSTSIIHSGNIQVSWIDDTSAFVSLSQTDQVQIGEFDFPDEQHRTEGTKKVEAIC